MSVCIWPPAVWSPAVHYASCLVLFCNNLKYKNRSKIHVGVTAVLIRIVE